MSVTIDSDLNALAEKFSWYWNDEKPTFRTEAVAAAVEFFKTRAITRTPNLKFNSDSYTDFIQEFTGVVATPQEIALAARSFGVYTSTSKDNNEDIKFYFACNPDKVNYSYFRALYHDYFESDDDMINAIYETMKQAKGRFGWLSLVTDQEPTMELAAALKNEVDFVVDNIRFGGYKVTDSLFFKINKDLREVYPGVKRLSFMLGCIFMGVNYRIQNSKNGDREVLLAMSKAK